MTNHERDWKILAYGAWIGVMLGFIVGYETACWFYEVAP